MPHFDNILFPVDFSTQCLQTASYVADVAKKFNSNVTLLHVLDAENPFGYGSLSSTITYGTDASELRAQHEKEITSFATSAFSGLCANRVITFGKPAEEIVRYACQHKMDLVLMPTHGYGGFKKLLLGSIATEVLCRAECPVWTTAHAEHLCTIGRQPITRIVCGLDLGPQSTCLVAIACDLANQYGASVRLVHAVGSDILDSGAPFQRFLRDIATSKVSELQCAARTHFQTYIRHGDPATVLRAAAEEHGAQLMIIGRGHARRFLGNLRTDVNNIIRESPCPVLSV